MDWPRALACARGSDADVVLPVAPPRHGGSPAARVGALATVVALAACSTLPLVAEPTSTAHGSASPTVSSSRAALTHPDMCGVPGEVPKLAAAREGEHYGFAQDAGDYSRIFLEGQSQTLMELDGVRSAVSPDARLIAYWWHDLGQPSIVQLRLLDLLDGSERTLPSEDELGGDLAWSCDERALIVAGRKVRQPRPGVRFDAPPPEYTALRRIDLAGGPTVEVARFPDEDVLPLAFNPRLGIVAAAVRVRGVAAAYLVVGSSVARWPLTFANIYHATIEVDRSATAVLAVGVTMEAPIATTVYRWPVGDAGSITGRSAGTDMYVFQAHFVAGSRDILVVVHPDRRQAPDRLERWAEDPRSPPRVVVAALPAGDTTAIVPRSDGAAYISTYRFQPGLSDVLRLLPDDTTEYVDVPATLMPLGRSVVLDDQAVPVLKGAPLTAALSRSEAAATVTALTHKVPRADRVEAKLIAWRDALRVGALRSASERKAMPTDAAVWAVAIAGDIEAVNGAIVVSLAYGVWFLDGQSGAIVGFQGDQRHRYLWPFYWDDLLDRAPDAAPSGVPAPGRGGDPVDFTLRDPCGYASAPFREGPEVVWIIDCMPQGNRNARATVGPMLESEGWSACGSGLASATWTLRDLVITVSQGGGPPPGYIRLTQRPVAGSC